MKDEKNFEFVVCPTCGIDDTRPLFGVQEIVLCRRCGLIYANPRLSNNDTVKFFEQQYIPDEQMLRQQFGDWRRETLRRESNLIKFMKKPGRILDIGCAGGEFLKHFIDEGWECGGVEPSEVASERTKKLGVRIYGRTLQEAVLRSKYFDVISFIDMLPIVPSPLEDFNKAYGALKDDGLIAIELPGLTYRVLRNYGPLSLIINHRWNNFSPASLHLFYFSTSSLRRLLDKAGFHIVKIIPEMAPLRGSALLQLINRIHFAFSRFLFILTFGKINVSAKIFYICQKKINEADHGI